MPGDILGVKMQKLKQKLDDSIKNGALQKITLSGCFDGSVKKATYTVKTKKDTPYVFEEKFTKDGKAYHAYLPYEGAAEHILSSSGGYKQTDVSCADFSAVVLRSKKGAVHIKYLQAKQNNVKQTDDKNYILSPDKKYDFLTALKIQDVNGRVHDKRQSKFRQINRFLQIVSDITPSLPEDDITVWDLCCGKSYLSFAVYYYFRYVLDREIKIVCVDRKEDVIKECGDIAKSIGFDGMEFICGDIFKCLPNTSPDLVLSLHACDTATDMVLSEAVKRGAKVILSSPCCQHELSTQIKCDGLNFVLKEPILKQKLSSIFTDALRCKLLHAGGYRVTVLEFIDPDETPKNLMIRAEKTYVPKNIRKAEYEEYNAICKTLNVEPAMKKLLDVYLSDLL